VKKCCTTRNGQYSNIAYRPGADVGQCMKCKAMYERVPEDEHDFISLDWRPITYVIEEELLP